MPSKGREKDVSLMCWWQAEQSANSGSHISRNSEGRLWREKDDGLAGLTGRSDISSSRLWE
jgi:hypothetical protein